MDMRQLRYFVTIVEEKNNITQAAKKLNLSQPPLSHQLKMLEQSLDISLFERKNKKLELTQAGEVLYQRALQLLESFENVQNELQDMKHGTQGQISIGVAGFYAYLVPDKIKDFHKQYPQVTFRIISADANRLGQLLDQNEIQIAIINLPINIPTDKFTIAHLGYIGFSLYVPKQWNWPIDKKEISIQELEDIPLILTKREKGKGGSYEDIQAECLQAGIQPNILAECNDVHTAFALVNTGIGATIMPNNMHERQDTQDMNVVHIPFSNLKHESAILWRSQSYLSSTLKQFLLTFGIKDLF